MGVMYTSSREPWGSCTPHLPSHGGHVQMHDYSVDIAEGGKQKNLEKNPRGTGENHGENQQLYSHETPNTISPPARGLNFGETHW